MTGREFFDTHIDNDDKCKLLQEMDEAQLESWETSPVSAFSPGVVTDDELLYQQVVDPTHIAPGGDGLKAMAFDVCSSHGLSTHRIAHSSVPELIAKGKERAAKWNERFPDKPQRSLWGFVPFLVADIRKILCKESGTRGLFVYDTAYVDDVAHAEVCQGGAKSNTKLHARNVRSSLYLLAKQRLISLDQLQAPH